MLGHQIVVLAYNEEAAIGGLLSDLAAKWGCLVVADGNDRTGDIAASYGCGVLKSINKRGYGRALVDGLTTSYTIGYKFATVMDVGTCMVRDIHLPIKSNVDVLVRNRVASRINKRVVLSAIASIGLSVATKTAVKDATFGFRTYKLDSVVPLLSRLQTNGHSTNMELLGLAIKSGLNIEYQPVPYIIEGHTQLKSKDLREALRTLWNLATIRRSSMS